MSKRRTERLLSIVVLLLSARRYLTADEIRASVIGYPEQDDAFKRMFERDKEELRDLGIPLETGLINPLDDETGYRISQQDYALPEITLEADEAAMLGIAAQAWEGAFLAGAATGALQKLRAGGVDDSTVPGFEPRLHTQEAAFGPLWEAVRDRRLVTFSYRALASTETLKRTLEPWGLVNRDGRWYVAGHDRLRAGTRVFRLSRIAGPVKMAGRPGGITVPEGTDVRSLVARWWTKPDNERGTAVLRIREGAGHTLRRREDARAEPDGPGWDRVSVSYPLGEPWYTEHLATFGPDVIVLEPPPLRDAVIEHLKGMLP
ncbi:MAG: WYL domain-containing protein [Streptosporangiales bacterium]|jgi:proteasome accessory factor B|nr:WYL domain-containing protein [Streptosporangiales bacterium]